MAYVDIVTISMPSSLWSIPAVNMKMKAVVDYLAEKLFVDRWCMSWTLRECGDSLISCCARFPDITDAYRDQVLRPGISKYLPEGSQIFFSSKIYGGNTFP